MTFGPPESLSSFVDENSIRTEPLGKDGKGLRIILKGSPGVADPIFNIQCANDESRVC